MYMAGAPLHESAVLIDQLRDSGNFVTGIRQAIGEDSQDVRSVTVKDDANVMVDRVVETNLVGDDALGQETRQHVVKLGLAHGVQHMLEIGGIRSV